MLPLRTWPGLRRSKARADPQDHIGREGACLAAERGSRMADETKLEARVKSLERALAVRDDVEAIKRLLKKMKFDEIIAEEEEEAA